MQALLQAATALTASAANRTTLGNNNTNMCDRPKPFTPVDDATDASNWVDWKFVYVNWLTQTDPAFEAELELVLKDVKVERPHSSMSADTLARSLKLYANLATLMKGKYLRIVKSVPEKNGYNAIRLLAMELQPAARNRTMAYMTAIISGPPCPVGGDFLDHLRGFETLIDEYEKMSNNKIPDDTKTASLLRITPEALADYLSLNMPEDSTYLQVKEHILAYYNKKKMWTPTAMPTTTPMDVDAVTKGKGKGKGKGNQDGKGNRTPQVHPACKHCGKTNHPEDKCFKKQAEGKGTKPTVFPPCKHCKRTNHAAKDCWFPGGAGKGGKGKGGKGKVQQIEDGTQSTVSTAASTTASSAGPSVSVRQVEVLNPVLEDSQSWLMAISCEECEHVVSEESVESLMHVNAVMSNTNSTMILFDSGSDEHVCPQSFAPATAIVKCDSLGAMRDAQGHTIPSIGTKTVNMHIGDRAEQSATAPFVVGPVKGPILSVGKLLRQGYTAHLDVNGSYLEKHGKRVMLALVRNSIYLPAEVRPISAPIAGTSASAEVPGPDADMHEAREGNMHDTREGSASGNEAILEDLFPEELALENARLANPPGSGAQEAIALPVPQAPAGDMQLHSASRVADMKRRLVELGAPVWGTKAQLWERLQQRTAWEDQKAIVQKALDQREHDLTANPAGDFAPLLFPGVDSPSPEMRAAHAATHLPFMPWCEFCQAGKSKDVPHRGLTLDMPVRGTPLVVMDFGNFDCEGPSEEGVSDTLVLADEDTGYPYAITSPDKKATVYLETCVNKFLTLLRHDSIRLRTDGEPTIVALANKIAKAREPKVTVLEVTPRYSSQSNGKAERTIQTVRRQAITIKLDVEARYRTKVLPSMWAWLIRHSAWLIARFHVKTNKRTCFHELHECHYNSEVLPFGETVLFREARPAHGRLTGGRRQKKGEAQFEKGIWVGRADEGDEHLVSCARGVIRTRTIRRMELCNQADISIFLSMQGLPWKLQAEVEPPRRVVDLPVPSLMPVGASNAESHDVAVSPSPIPPATPLPGSPAPQTPRSTGPLVEASMQSQSEGESSSSSSEIGDSEVTGPSVPTPPFVPPHMQPSSPRGLATARRAEDEIGSPNPKAPRLQDNIASPGGNATAPTTPMSTFPGAWGNFVGALTVDEEIEFDSEWLVEDKVAFPELSHAETEKMRFEGRRKELGHLEEFGVYQSVPFSQTVGKHKITTRWEDNLKWNDEGVLIMRCRFVGREYKALDPWRTDLFAPATSPSTCRIIDFVAVRRQWPTLIADALRAFYHASETEEVYVDPPWEWLQEQPDQTVKWQLLKQLPGRRKAAQAWVEFVAEVLLRRGFTRCVSMPCFFMHVETKVCLEVHMDDFHVTGPWEVAANTMEALKDEIDLKIQGPFGPGSKYQHLKRRRTRTDEGMLIQCGPTHIPKLLKLLSLETANPKPTPMIKEDVDLDPVLLEAGPAKLFRQGTGILMYIGNDRPECQFAIGCLTSLMANPTEFGMKALKHLARFLKGTQHWGVFIKAESNTPHVLKIRTDADWAGEKRTRKSTSAGHLLVDSSLLGSFSRRQSVIALASGESEYYAGVSGVAEGLMLQDVLGFFEFQLKIELYMDASAARGIANRQGVGKVRHLECKTLWLQQKVKDGIVKIFTVPGNDNSADLGTKVLTANRIFYLCGQIGIVDGETMQPIREHAVTQVVKPSTAIDNRAALSVLIASLIACLQTQATGHSTDFMSRDLVVQPVQSMSCPLPASIPAERDLMWLMQAIMCIFTVGFMLGMFCMYRWLKRSGIPDSTAKAADSVDTSVTNFSSSASSSSCKYETKETNTEVRVRHVSIQSQCTFKWKYAQPQFKYLPLDSAGAWHDDRF